MDSESDIELVAVSCKFDFSERRNLPNKEMDPDRELPKGFWGLSSLSPVHFQFPLLTLCWKYIKAGAFLPSSILNPLLLLRRLSLPLLPWGLLSLLDCLLSPANPQCLTTPPSVATYRRPPDLPPEKSPRNPGRPKLKVPCALSLAATPVG